MQDIEHPVSEINLDVGAHLRAVRTMYGLSQRELAKRAGVTNGLISLIEQNRVSPSVSSLKKVLDGIPMSLAEFFTLDLSASPQVFYRADELAVLGDRSVTFRLVAARRPNRAMSLLHEHYAPGADTGADMLRHQGEEFLYVLQGTVEVLSEFYEPITLRAGESIYIDSSMAHNVRAVGSKAARVLNIMTSSGQDAHAKR